MNKRKVILIDLTDKCTLDCSYCFSSKTQSVMSSETKEKCIEYIKQISKNDNSFYAFCISGGEPGLLDSQEVFDFLTKLKLLWLNAEYILSTNLVYKLTDDWLKVFHHFDSISTTYDYDVRFEKPNQRALFFKNLKTAVASNIKVNLTIILTKELIKAYTPQAMIDFILSSGVRSCEFYRIFLTKSCDASSSIRPDNSEMNAWLYEVYKLYLKYKNYFSCETFKSIEDAVSGQGCYEYTKYCVDNNLYIDVKGNINQCPAGLSLPFGNVASNKKVISIRPEQEKVLKEECKSCSINKYCNGGCYNWVWDKTGCPVPKRIFELALLNAEK